MLAERSRIGQKDSGDSVLGLSETPFECTPGLRHEESVTGQYYSESQIESYFKSRVLLQSLVNFRFQSRMCEERAFIGLFREARELPMNRPLPIVG
jgi:hypothetical protein